MTQRRLRRPAASPPTPGSTAYVTQGEQVAALSERLEATREQVRTTRAKPEDDMPDRSLLLEKIAALEAQIARTSQTAHDVRNNQQVRMAADIAAAKTPIAQRLSPVQAVASALIALVTIGGFVVAGLNTYASRQVDTSAMVARLTLLDTQMAQLFPLTGRIAAMENRMEQATRLRDQETQGMKDRLRALEQSDQSGIEKLQVLQQAIAGILPRLEEILRRQERLESRLGNTRPGATEDGPAIWRQTLPGRT